jgi:hypothetical protein
MFPITEQQAEELVQRCETIREYADTAIFAQIESIVQRAAVKGQLPEDDVNILFVLLNRVASDILPKEEIKTEDDGEDVPKKDTADQKQDRAMRNRILFSHNANWQSIAALRRSIKRIARPKQRQSMAPG